MENWITLSVDETELAFDAGGAVTLIPLNYIAEFDQISQERFYVKDTSNNEGEFHYRQTVYASPDALISFVSNYFDTPTRYIVDKDPALTDDSDYKAPSQSAVKTYLFNNILNRALTGISFASAATITAADTILSAFGKLQAQITSLFDWLNPSKTFTLYTDFTGNASTAATFQSDILALGFAGAATSVINTASEAGHVGIFTGGTGGTNTGYVYVGTTTGAMAFGDGETICESLIRIPTLSVLAERFTIRVGFTGLGINDPTNGAYFRYSDNVNGGNWQLVTRNGAEAPVNTAISPIANTWYKLKVVMNAGATLATFYIDGTSVGTLATNIGTSNISAGLSIQKSLGTTTRTLQCDYLYIMKTFTTPR